MNNETLLREMARGLQKFNRYTRSRDPFIAGASVALMSCQVEAQCQLATGENISAAQFKRWATDTLEWLQRFAADCLPLMREMGYASTDGTAVWVSAAIQRLSAQTECAPI